MQGLVCTTTATLYCAVQLVGLDTCNYVFTDISFGESDRARLAVVREPSGRWGTDNCILSTLTMQTADCRVGGAGQTEPGIRTAG